MIPAAAFLFLVAMLIFAPGVLMIAARRKPVQPHIPAPRRVSSNRKAGRL